MLRSVLLGCAVALLAAAPARAAELVVNNLGDGPGSCPAVCTLRAAITAANTGDTITLPAGTIALSAGALQITRPLTIQGQGTKLDPAYTSRIFDVTAALTLSRVTLSRGQSTDINGGSAIWMHGGGVTLDRVVLDGNSNSVSGGAIRQSGGTLRINDSEVRANHASSGGGLYMTSGSAIVDRTLWLGNDGSTGGGGAIYANGGALTVTNSTFADNTVNSGHGGAIYVAASGTTLRNVTFEANVASGNNGGGSALWSDLVVVTSNVLFGESGYQESCGGVQPADQGGSVDAASSCGLSASDLPVRLGPLDPNGGIARSFLPWAGSAGVDAGDDATCTALDQRSATRAHSAADHCDAGAVEGVAAISAPPPVVAGETATPGARAVRIDATVNRQGLTTGYHVDLGTTTDYDTTVPDSVPFGPGWGAQPVGMQLGGLEPATTYHYRVVAVSDGGTLVGPDRTFTTLAADAIAITAAPAAFTTATTVEFRFAPSVGVGELECTLTGPGQTGDPAFCADSISYDLTGDGDYTFTVRAEDGSVSATRTFTLDRTLPPAPELQQTGDATFTFSSEPGATFECSIDGGAFAPCTSPAHFDGLPPGNHTLTVRGTDPAGNASTSSRTFAIAAVAQSTPVPAPTPVAQKDATGVPSGTVLIKQGGKFVPFDPSKPIPDGAEIDVTKGKITLTAILKPGGKPQTATFYDGIFKLKLGKTTTDLTLSQPLAKCAKKAAAAAKKPKTRKLWGNGSGSFRTRGQYSAATVRGTTWLVQDSCAGTLTQVKKGVVSVFDQVKKKTIVVRAGRKYLARPTGAGRSRAA
jgi:CSLREA domain-containing protein